uniref:Uncharacterized protein n=1 Tax=Anopheles melas TaxID=34690 RepID=A0A182UH96_9DIPT
MKMLPLEAGLLIRLVRFYHRTIWSLAMAKGKAITFGAKHFGAYRMDENKGGRKGWTDWRLDLADLIDLRLQVGDDFTRHLIAEQLEQIDALAAGDGLEGGHLNALLHALDLGVLRDQLLGLGLPDGFIGQGATVALGRGHGQGNEGEQADSNLHDKIYE